MTTYKYQIDDRAQAKGGLISLSVFTLIFIGVFIFFFINYDAYSETAYSIKRQADVQTGWAPTVVGWGYFAIPFATFCIFLLAMTRDFKHGGVGIAEDHIFLNKDGIKATKVAYSQIKELKEDEHNIDIKLNDYSEVISNTFFLFRGAKKRKYVKKDMPFQISKMDLQDQDTTEIMTFLKSKVV